VETKRKSRGASSRAAAYYSSVYFAPFARPPPLFFVPRISIVLFYSRERGKRASSSLFPDRDFSGTWSATRTNRSLSLVYQASCTPRPVSDFIFLRRIYLIDAARASPSERRESSLRRFSRSRALNGADAARFCRTPYTLVPSPPRRRSHETIPTARPARMLRLDEIRDNACQLHARTVHCYVTAISQLLPATPCAAFAYTAYYVPRTIVPPRNRYFARAPSPSLSLSLSLPLSRSLARYAGRYAWLVLAQRVLRFRILAGFRIRRVRRLREFPFARLHARSREAARNFRRDCHGIASAEDPARMHARMRGSRIHDAPHNCVTRATAASYYR